MKSFLLQIGSGEVEDDPQDTSTRAQCIHEQTKHFENGEIPYIQSASQALTPKKPVEYVLLESLIDDAFTC